MGTCRSDSGFAEAVRLAVLAPFLTPLEVVSSLTTWPVTVSMTWTTAHVTGLPVSSSTVTWTACRTVGSSAKAVAIPVNAAKAPMSRAIRKRFALVFV